MSSTTYKIAIPQISANITISVDKYGLVSEAVGYVGCLPISYLLPGMYGDNDNIFDKAPNFTVNGFSFTVTGEEGVVVYYNLSSHMQNTVDDVTITHYDTVMYGNGNGSVEQNILQATFLIFEVRECEDGEDEPALHSVCKKHCERKYNKAYFIECPNLLLRGTFTVDCDKVICNLKITLGENKATILLPTLYNNNLNLFKCGNITMEGLGFSTMSSSNLLTFYNIMYVDGNYVLSVQVKADITTHVDALPIEVTIAEDKCYGKTKK